MSDSVHSCNLTLTPVDNRRLVNLCGRFDEHLRQIERRLKIEITNRGNVFQLVGSERSIQIASQVLKSLYHKTGEGIELTPTQIHLALQQQGASALESHFSSEGIADNEKISLQIRKGEILPRTANQKHYVENILTHDVNFGIGPAGTGKTFLAVACAVAALEQEKSDEFYSSVLPSKQENGSGFCPGILPRKSTLI